MRAMDSTHEDYEHVQTACAVLSLMLFYCMTNLKGDAIKTLVNDVLEESAPLCRNCTGTSI